MALLLQAVNTPPDPEIWLVCLMGVGVVFVGLIGIILLCKLLSLISLLGKKKEEAPAPAAAPSEERTEISGELASVIGCAVAEELGCDVSGIRIVSIKKIG